MLMQQRAEGQPTPPRRGHVRHPDARVVLQAVPAPGDEVLAWRGGTSPAQGAGLQRLLGKKIEIFLSSSIKKIQK